ncbi:MAG: hypothetical protein WC748_04530 [Legionellales bacterium]|jgi:hypothetical protein
MSLMDSLRDYIEDKPYVRAFISPFFAHYRDALGHEYSGAEFRLIATLIFYLFFAIPILLFGPIIGLFNCILTAFGADYRPLDPYGRTIENRDRFLFTDAFNSDGYYARLSYEEFLTGNIQLSAQNQVEVTNVVNALKQFFPAAPAEAEINALEDFFDDPKYKQDIEKEFDKALGSRQLHKRLLKTDIITDVVCCKIDKNPTFLYYQREELEGMLTANVQKNIRHGKLPTFELNNENFKGPIVIDAACQIEAIKAQKQINEFMKNTQENHARNTSSSNSLLAPLLANSFNKAAANETEMIELTHDSHPIASKASLKF